MNSPWPQVPLGDITSAQYGLSVAKADNGTIPILGMKNLQEGRIDFENLTRVNLTPNEIVEYEVQAGDILFNRTNSFDLVGKTSLVEESTPEPTVFASYLVRFKVDLTKAFPAFINYYLNSPQSEKRLKDMATPGVSQFNINPTSLRKHFLVPLPSLEKQKSVASVLSLWDRGIRQLTDLLDAKIRFKQGVMQQLLTGKRRFNGCQDKWRLVLLRDVTTECEDRNRGGHGLDSVMAVTKADGIIPMRARTIGKDIGRYLIVRKNWFAYNPMRINIGSIARWSGENNILVSPDYVVFRCNDTNGDGPALDPDYLDHLRRSGLWEKFVTSAGNGSVRVRIYFSDLGHLKFMLPPLAEQRKIAAFLNSTDHEIELLRKELDALKQQKKGLMQKLLTGEIRVKIPRQSERNGSKS